MSISKTIGVILAGVLVVTLGLLLTVLVVSSQRTASRTDALAGADIEHAISDSLVFAMAEGITNVEPYLAELQGVGSIAEVTVKPTSAVRKGGEDTMDALEREVLKDRAHRSTEETFKDKPVTRSVTAILSVQKCAQCHAAPVGQPLAILSVRRSTAEAAAAISYQRWLSIAGGVVSVGLAFGLLMLLITRRVVRPLGDAVGRVGRLASGHLDQTVVVERTDEIGVLMSSLQTLQKALASKAEAADQISRGNLAVDIDVQSDGDVLAQAMVRMRNSLTAMAGETEVLVNAAVGGRLSVRADASRHEGSFRKIVDGVNQTLDAVIGPLNVAAGVRGPDQQGRHPAEDHRQLQRRLQRDQEQPEHVHRRGERAGGGRGAAGEGGGGGQAGDAGRRGQARRRLPEDRRGRQPDAGRGDRAAERGGGVRGPDQQGRHPAEDHRQLQRRLQRDQEQPEHVHRRGERAGGRRGHAGEGGGGRASWRRAPTRPSTAATSGRSSRA